MSQESHSIASDQNSDKDCHRMSNDTMVGWGEKKA